MEGSLVKKKEWKKKKSFSAGCGNTGRGVFKGGIERFLAKNQV